MVVYLDLIFLMNLLIDGSLLAATAWMRKLKPAIWRLILSAGVGASYVVMMFLPELSFMFTFIVKFLFSVAMLWIAFGFGSLQNYLRNLGAFYIVNFVAAGGILGIHYLMQNSGELWNGIFYTATGGMQFSLKVGAVFVLVVFFAVLAWFRLVLASRRRQERLASFFAEVRVRIDEAEVRCTGLVDTGNQLTDPLSRLPVMVMETSLFRDYLPDTLTEPGAGMQADNLLLECAEDEAFPWRDRLRLVPYRGINKGSQFMLAMKPDEVGIMADGREFVTNRVLIGLDAGRLSAEGAYRAIIHPALTDGEACAPGAGNDDAPPYRNTGT
ncbi:sigma-E processing peptidase SpoIIGA [Paenibacillus sp. M1]|uniref:Sigma-E processing peptidase SpoIIGA n=1 Tax=Paenibacillus haidiansis TaxID=1574488 RepID=A0ABU7VMS2_9BACL